MAFILGFLCGLVYMLFFDTSVRVQILIHRLEVEKLEPVLDKV